MTSRGLFALAFAFCAACSDGRARLADPGPAGLAPTTNVTPLGPQFGDAGTVHDGAGQLVGTVFAPNGTIPISGALVYTTPVVPAALPKMNHCDACVQLASGTDYTFSKADGSFALPLHSVGPLNLVVQKGAFRRVRTVNLGDGRNTAPVAATTLPGQSSPTLGDSIPSIGVLSGDFDPIQNALVKFGLKTSVGFTVLSDAWTSLLQDAKALSAYQVLFLPCSDTKNPDKSPTDTTAQQNLQDFVAAGGRVYVTDWAYDWVTQLWPHYVDLVGESSTVGSGWLAHEDRPATVVDPGLAAWMSAQGIASWTATGNFTTIDQVNTIATTSADGGTADVTPTVWVTGSGVAGDKPTTVSFPSACGKVMFSTYHAEGDVTSKYLTAQELALLYILLEVDVCTDSSNGVLGTPN